MHKYKWLWAACFVVANQALAADFGLSAGYWDYRVAGSVERDGISQDFQSDLDVKANRHDLYAFTWSTGPGWWRPDLAASYTPIKVSGQRTVQASGANLINLLGIGSSSTTLVKGDADLADIDLTARYPAQLGTATVWGGITIKHLSGTVVTRNSSDVAENNQSINQTFPMLHLSGKVPLTSWLAITVQGNVIKYQDDSANDFCVAVSLGFLGPIGLDLGWQRKSFKISQPDFKLDTTLSGLLLGASIALH